jgi:hypothetical protein
MWAGVRHVRAAVPSFTGAAMNTTLNGDTEMTDIVEEIREAIGEALPELDHLSLAPSQIRRAAQAAYTIVERRIGELQRVAEQGEAALQAMMDAWFDFHDHHSLTQPVTGAAGCAFELALEARDKIRASLEQRSDQ